MLVRRLRGARPVGTAETAAVLRVLDEDPITNCLVAGRVQSHGLIPGALGGEMWTRGTVERALCFVGGNLVPLRGDTGDLRAFAERAVRFDRTCTAVVGRAALVLPLWDWLAPEWGPAREIRPDQPLLALSTPPQVEADPAVRRVRPAEFEAFFAASVAMFIEEVGIDPRRGDGGVGYRRRVAEIVRSGSAYARIDDGEVVFKAEIGARSDRVGQINGVWVLPRLRGQGLGTAGTATLAAELQRRGLTPSLYVNAYNTTARRSYDRIGFTEVDTFATVLID